MSLEIEIKTRKIEEKKSNDNHIPKYMLSSPQFAEIFNQKLLAYESELKASLKEVNNIDSTQKIALMKSLITDYNTAVINSANNARDSMKKLSTNKYIKSEICQRGNSR
jgi:hypothetical protein